MNFSKNAHLLFAKGFAEETLEPYLYLLSKKLHEGHVCLDLEKSLTRENFKKNEEEVHYDSEFLNPDSDFQQSQLIGTDELDYKPFIYHRNYLYLHRYFKYETEILKQISEFALQENTNLEKLKENHTEVREVLKEITSQKTNWQIAAVISATLNQFTIITGGPGTGKTFTIAILLKVLNKLQPNLKVALAAPTGKAANRMKESLSAIAKNDLNMEPKTIHRLLGYQKNSIYFKRNEDNPLEEDLVIIDESSMIDVALFAKLLKAINPATTRLILLGDRNQLASVEAGSLFGDLCLATDSNVFSKKHAEIINGFIPDPKNKIEEIHIQEQDHILSGKIIELQESRRFTGDGGIGKFSKAIIENEVEKIKTFFDNSDAEIQIDQDYSSEILTDFAAGFEAYIKEENIESALNLLNDCRILCAVRNGKQGIYQMNTFVEKYLSEKGLIKKTSGEEFYENRPVIINSNNYELGLYNGDIGLVRTQKNSKGEDECRVWFIIDDQLQSFSPGLINSCDTVFAMTIHKSQGSEFQKVLVVLPKKKKDHKAQSLLTRELLYTGVTRAVQKAIIQADENSILKCAERKVERGSGIIERLKIENS